ncbi:MULTISPECIES: hypothetical protein [Paenibacillus]|uniref:Uncharacterized protein n=1 Tax=Paenibacillus validus TaxID=44253 RepID=A0A7X2Z6V7_9BACL|nr:MULTISPECIES: hypothetical protein [Paenibacillus]MED4609190.1 hypothetical protein [Paenibacillus validus]MUG69449.1 hypothetical protein [Paenibacillus validus]
MNAPVQPEAAGVRSAEGGRMARSGANVPPAAAEAQACCRKSVPLQAMRMALSVH